MEYEKATKFVLRALKTDHNSMAAAKDLLYIKHNYILEERLVNYIDSINVIYDNEVLSVYSGNRYLEYSRIINCNVPRLPVLEPKNE